MRYFALRLVNFVGLAVLVVGHTGRCSGERLMPCLVLGEFEGKKKKKENKK